MAKIGHLKNLAVDFTKTQQKKEMISCFNPVSDTLKTRSHFWLGLM